MGGCIGISVYSRDLLLDKLPEACEKSKFLHEPTIKNTIVGKTSWMVPKPLGFEAFLVQNFKWIWIDDTNSSQDLIRQNLAFAIFVKLFALTLAFTGRSERANGNDDAW